MAAPSPEQKEQHAAELDRLERIYLATPQFGDRFWLQSKAVADRTGPPVLHTLLERSLRWQGEQGMVGMIFVPLVALLPRAETIRILQGYVRSTDPRKKWAHEFLVELDSPDIKESVAIFSRSK